MTDHAPVSRDDLPIPDYDHLPVTGLGHRIRSLDRDQVQTLLSYEQQHGDRLPVVEVLRARLKALADGADPSGGDAADVAPELSGGAAGGSKVSPQTQGPPPVPPQTGDMMNPGAPVTPGPRT
ncbi:hypothetical protein [Actinotalea sp. K2]|uniref:hypothetical protein n=1 Tax=Actinotalea sp. K2 TaxID=2939438 RepID=UPI002016CEAC|nr:hypothetical protein [Actinotalea sp. K2]MCL3861338.1 hypothetical protein [Actinotalea sp. K2]